jgi:hypothetical protein
LTPEQHKTYLAWSHIGYGAFFLLMMVFFLAIFGVALLGASRGSEGPPIFVMTIMWLFIAAIYGAMTIPSFVAGYGLLKQKRWAKTWTIIAGVLSAMSFPIGTAVCVYSFWFLFSEPGKAIFERQKYALPPRRQEWAPQSDFQNQPTTVYVPPTTPPDWR